MTGVTGETGERMFLVKSEERRYTLGVVYEPDVLDTQREFAKAEDIEAAAWGFMGRLQTIAAQGARVLKSAVDGRDAEIDVTELDDELEKAMNPLDVEHLQLEDRLGVIVESYVAPCDMTVGGEAVRKGSWLMGVVWEPAPWERVRKGELTGFSMYGRTGRA